MLGLHTGECGRRRAKLRFEWAVFSFTNVWYAKTKKGLAFVEIEFQLASLPCPDTIFCSRDTPFLKYPLSKVIGARKGVTLDVISCS